MSESDLSAIENSLTSPDVASGRINVVSGTPWEPLRAFSRAVLFGDQLFISGTTALTNTGEVVGVGKPYEQTRFILDRIRKICQLSGLSLGEVVRTRLFVTNMSAYEDIARAHREVFDESRPASAILQVSRLADPRLLIEIEADAIRGAFPSASVRLVE